MRRLLIAFLYLPFLLVAQNAVNLDSLYLKFRKQLFRKDTGAWEKLKRLEDLSANNKAAAVYFHLAKADSYMEEGEREQAFGSCLNALDKAKEANSDSLVFRVYYKMGSVYMEFSDLPHALPYFNKAILLIGSVKNLDDRILLYKDIGLLNTYLDRNKEAINYFLKMEPLILQTGNKNYLGNIYNNMGIIYVDLLDSAKALSYYRKSLAIRKEINDLNGIGQVHNNLGSLYYNWKQYDRALEYYKQGLELRKRSNGPVTGEIESNINIGRTYYKLNQVAKAKQYLEAARETTVRQGLIELERRANEELLHIYSAGGDFKKAFELQGRYYMIRDSLYGLDMKEEIGRMSFENKLREDSLKHAEAQQKETVIHEEKEKRAALIRNIFIAGFVMVLVVAFLLFKQVKRIKQANKIIAQQKDQIELKQKEMLDSIHYARRIQQSLLASESYIKRNMKRLLEKQA